MNMLKLFFLTIFSLPAEILKNSIYVYIYIYIYRGLFCQLVNHHVCPLNMDITFMLKDA